MWHLANSEKKEPEKPDSRDIWTKKNIFSLFSWTKTPLSEGNIFYKGAQIVNVKSKMKNWGAQGSNFPKLRHLSTCDSFGGVKSNHLVLFSNFFSDSPPLILDKLFLFFLYSLPKSPLSESKIFYRGAQKKGARKPRFKG